MKNYFLIAITTVLVAFNAVGQTRGVKIGYIDMEYILEKVPDYAQAKSLLEEKAQKWKQEIEEKKLDIAKLKETLKSEKVLLTKELIEEREEEIAFQENELLEYQQKRFGPTGDLVTQKAVLVKPIQDQVFNAVQDIAEAKKYDFVFDRSSDLTMLFAAQRYDISDQVVRVLVRAQNREQKSKKQLEKEAEQERKQEMIDDNPNLTERQKILEQKKLEREKLAEERKLALEEKKQAAEDRRKQQLADKEAKKNGTVSDKGTNEAGKVADDPKESGAEDTSKEDKKAKAEEAKKKTLEERKKIIEDRKKDLEERRKKLVEEREAAKKAKEEEKNKPK